MRSVLASKPTEPETGARRARRVIGGRPPSAKTLKRLANLKLAKEQINRGTKRGQDLLARSMDLYGYGAPIVADRNGTVIAGRHRLEEALQRGDGLKVRVVQSQGGDVIVHQRTDLDLEADGDGRAKGLMLADNRVSQVGFDVDPEALARFLEAGVAVKDFYFDEELALALSENGREAAGLAGPGRAGSLTERFLVPPFSVLDARQGYWQERKRAWLALGIESEKGRPGTSGLGPAVGKNSVMNRLTGRLARDADSTDPVISVFDPVLCELAYRWFCPPGGLVLDPFAGGSVRGIVASRLGRGYLGIELRSEQVAANRGQLPIAGSPPPEWIEGDARALDALWPKGEADLVFTCPPYGDTEIYSDDARDISNFEHEAFLAALGEIVTSALARLRPDRFACFVVGDFRDSVGGCYRGFPAAMIRLAEAAGVRLYNEAVFVTPVATVGLRAARSFLASRKLGKTHQNVLVFCKGDARRATQAVGPVECGTSVDAMAPDPAQA